MAKFCSKDCEFSGPICDFCKHYDFNANENGSYVDEGYCNFHRRQRDPLDGCNDFVCASIVKGGEQWQQR